MKHIENFIVERLKLNNDSKINTKLSETESTIKEIVNNFKKLQKDNKLKPFYNKFDWNKVSHSDFREAAPEDIKNAFYARTTKDKEEANRTLILYKDNSKNYYPWREASIGKNLFTIGDQENFSKWGPNNLPYGPTFDNSTKEKYEFVKNRKAYIVKLQLK
jgi:hypothetical protein